MDSRGPAPRPVVDHRRPVGQGRARMVRARAPVPGPPPAPAFLFQVSQGDPVNRPIGTVLTFQGAMVDPGTAGARPGSVTNGMVVTIL